MTKITDVVMRMQNELRNKEGITGIDAMHHINMVLLSKSFDKEMCEKLGIPESLSFNELSKLSQKELMKAFYTQRPVTATLLYYIRLNKRFGYDKDIAFQITNESTLKYLYTQVVEIPTEELFETVDIIGDIYEHFINREGKTMKDLGQYFTDRTLIKYLVNLVNPKLNKLCESIWDPSAGTGGFLIEYISYLNKKYENIDWSINKNQIYGNDINKNTSALLKQNLYYSFREDCGPVEMKDSLLTDSDIKYDNILANPPFGVKGLKYKEMNKDIKALEINGTKGEILFLQLCMTRLNENGKCAVVVPEGVLFNSTKMYKNTRKHLLENFNLKKVIKVGEGEFFKNTGVKTSVLYFENTGPTASVEFIQVNKVNDSIEEVPLMTVEMHKIIENDYSLNMNLYKEIVLDVNDDFEVVELEDIVNQIKDPLKKDDITSEYIECINIGAVDSNSNYYNLFKQSKIDYKNKSMNISKRGDILLSSVRPNLKKNIIVNDEILFNSGFINLRVNKDNINSKYLYYVLNHDIINDILVDIASSSSSLYPTINFNIIKNLKIPVPPLEVQNRIVEQLDNIYETEIESSKNLINSLKMSIETIMKNTMYRDDLQEYKIKEVCDINTGKSLKKEEKICGNIPYYGSNGPIAKYNVEQKNGEYIITGRVGTIGKYYYINGPFAICDNAFHIKNKTNNITKYIYFNFQYNAVIDCNDTVVSQISKSYFNDVKIHIPPIEVQKQILEKIEPKESLIQELEKNIERAQKEAKDIMQVLFN
jgi:type I restriction enzyme M protein